MQKLTHINRVDRSKTALIRGFNENNLVVNVPPDECVGIIWELTRELWSISGSSDAERRLQRHITTLRR
jgi:hypothetical protein